MTLMQIPLVILSVSLCWLAFLPPSESVVDESAPDLSGFKLRHVDVKELARQRAQQPITSLSSGAISMREALFVEANNVKCPAYAHLFKLIKLFSGAERGKVIKQNVVQALALVATYDRVIYHKLFLSSIPESTDNFLEALLGLERESSLEAKKTIFDLIGCLSQYMTSQRVVEFLSIPARAAALASIEQFESIPVDEERAPTGLVAGLINKFQREDPNVNQNELDEAEKLVREFDNDFMASLRIDILSQQTSDESESALVEPVVAPTMTPSEEEMKHIKLPAELELPVPDNDDLIMNANPQNGANGKPFTLDQLASLKFIKMRLEGRQKDAPKLSMRLAFDFISHWDDLCKSSFDTSNEVGSASFKFRNDPKNLELVERVRKVIDEYGEMINVLAEIETLGDKLNSIDDLKIPLEKLNVLLGKIDKAFDLNDVRRLQTIWKLKFTEFNTMQRFLDDSLHW